LTIRAHNGVAADALQTFSLVVSAPAPPPVPTARPVTAQLVSVKVGKKRKLVVQALFADTGALANEFLSPFQKPAFKHVEVSALDTNGDGVPDAVVVTAKKGKRTVIAVLPG
jgi:hypothetical protein